MISITGNKISLGKTLITTETIILYTCSKKIGKICAVFADQLATAK